MRFSHNTQQTSFLDVGIMEVQIESSHPLMRINAELDWDAMVEIVGKEYCHDNGRPCKSIRMMLGLEIAKHVLGESDQSVTRRLQTDLALQVFCGFSSLCHDVPHASTLTYFRKRLRENTLQELEDVNLRRFQKKLPMRKRHQVITDSTCMPANITHPFDSRLLTQAWSFLVRELEKQRKGGARILIRGRRNVESALASFRLKSRKTREQIDAVRALLITEGKKLLRAFDAHIRQQKQTLNRRTRNLLASARIILAQQEQMLRSGVRSIKDRIVSLHEPMIRPIVRGKETKRVEFGKKITFNLVGGTLLQTARMDHHAFSDKEMVVDACTTHQRTFGRKPSELNADRGAHSPDNHALLKKEKIKDGIQWRGRIPHAADPPPRSSRKRMERQRSGIEARIGIWKNAYGGHRNTYREANAHVLITFGLLGMNALAVAA